MKKRFIAILLTVILVISYLPGDIPFFSAISVSAETTEDYTYVVLSDGTVQITKYKGTASEVEIPQTIDGKAVTSIGDSAFFNSSVITSVTIPDGVTSIGKYAFYGCSNLISVTIPDSVMSIGDYGFAGCSKLKSVTIPGNEGILDAEGIFTYCQGLESVTILDGVTSIGGYTFDGCNVLKTLTIPDSVSVVGRYAFNNTAWYFLQSDGLIYVGKVAYKYKYTGTIPMDTSITLKEGTTSITSNAFDICANLIEITIPDSVESIGMNAFYACTNLSDITIPGSVTSIGVNAFYKTAWYDHQPDGLIYVGRVAYKYKGNMPENTSITLKEGTTSITGNAFDSCANLIDITIPHSVTSIGEYAFLGCMNLTSITIPETVTSIGDSAYANANGTVFCYASSAADTYAKTILNGMKVRYLIDKYSTTLVTTSYTYDGAAKTPEVTVDGLTKEKDYDVEYKNNTEVGTATVTIEGKGDYAGTITKSFAITVSPIDDFSATLETTSYTYDGIAKTPEVTVKNEENTLVLDTDYTVSYENNTDAGTATVTITGKGNYAGTITKTFTINPSPIDDFSATLSTIIYTYSGKVKVPDITVKHGENTLVLDTDYTVSYEDNTDAGTATVTITGVGNYAGTITKTFTINQRAIDDFSATLSTTSYTYDGKAKTPDITVKDVKKTLILDTDYTVSYEKNTDAGTATVTITGIGNYAGSITKNFTISVKSISDLTATLSTTSYTYDRTAKTPGVTVKHGEKTLTLGTDYTVSYANNTNPGTATVTITGKGNYAGIITKTFTITAKSISALTAKLSTTTYTYNGKAKKPSVTLKHGAKVLVLNKDYTVTYTANINPGKATVILKGKGNYTGTLKKTYAIKMATPNLSLTAGKKKVAIKWGKVTGASGYDVFMSTSKSGKYKGIKSANQKTYTFTKTGLTKGKTYYFKVRTYKKVNGKKIYSAYSTIKAIKVK